MNDSLKNFFSFWGEVLEVVVLALIIVIPIRYFLFQPFVVDGSSMEPNFYDGDYLIVDQISYRFRSPERGEVIIFYAPTDPSRRFIKRVVGLPGESLETVEGQVEITDQSGELFILDEEYHPWGGMGRSISITLEDHQYFVVGDNRDRSYDSRFWGYLPEENIIGRAIIRLWPLGRINMINR
jgi:signal peptidase I